MLVRIQLSRKSPWKKINYECVTEDDTKLLKQHKIWSWLTLYEKLSGFHNKSFKNFEDCLWPNLHLIAMTYPLYRKNYIIRSLLYHKVLCVLRNLRFLVRTVYHHRMYTFLASFLRSSSHNVVFNFNQFHAKRCVFHFI